MTCVSVESSCARNNTSLWIGCSNCLGFLSWVLDYSQLDFADKTILTRVDLGHLSERSLVFG